MYAGDDPTIIDTDGKETDPMDAQNMPMVLCVVVKVGLVITPVAGIVGLPPPVLVLAVVPAPKNSMAIKLNPAAEPD